VTNRVTPYEAGWLTFLVNAGLCTDSQAREAMHRVAQDAVDELNARREAKKRLKRKRRKDD
jgi:hypothetical protein